LCSGTTRVDLGSYSSIDIVCAAATAEPRTAESATTAARTRSAGRTGLLCPENRVDLPRVVDVVAGEQPADVEDGEAAELAVARPTPKGLRREHGQQRDVRAPERGEEREALPRIPFLVAADAGPDLLVHAHDLRLVALEHRPDAVAPQELDLGEVRQ